MPEKKNTFNNDPSTEAAGDNCTLLVLSYIYATDMIHVRPVLVGEGDEEVWGLLLHQITYNTETVGVNIVMCAVNKPSNLWRREGWWYFRGIRSIRV